MKIATAEIMKLVVDTAFLAVCSGAGKTLIGMTDEETDYYQHMASSVGAEILTINGYFPSLEVLKEFADNSDDDDGEDELLSSIKDFFNNLPHNEEES